MITKIDWIKFFPFKEVRPQQVNAINFILNSIENGEKFILMNAETGIGKSVIAVTIARYFANKLKKSYFLTTQKNLQKQYVNDFGGKSLREDLQSVFAATNYQCNNCYGQSSCAEIRSTFSFSNESYIDKCKTGSCIYTQHKNSFVQGDLSLTNYAFFLSHQSNPETIGIRDFMFYDECHNIEKEISSFVGFEITRDFCTVLNIPFCEEFIKDKIFNWIKDTYTNHVNKQVNKLQKDVEKKVNSHNTEQLQEWTQYSDKLHTFIDNYKADEENWVFNKNGEIINFSPIDVSKFAQNSLFRFSNINILMSATIINFERFAESIGIKKYVSISIDSPFSFDNRPVFYHPAGSLSYDKIDQTLPTIVNYINEILDIHKDNKGIIHSASYKITKYIADNIKNERLLIQDKNNKNYIMDTHATSKLPTVLVSPGMSEGVDLKDDLSRFQIIVKLPYPNLGDQLILARKDRWSWFYPFETIKTLIQSIGRSIRNEDDYCDTFILDGSFEMFLKRNKKLFPESFVKLIEYSNNES